MRKLRLAVATLGVFVTAVVFVATATADDDDNRGFLTERPAMLTQGDVLVGNDLPEVEITPLISVGDRLSRRYQFEAIPDGISILGRGGGDDDDDDDDEGGGDGISDGGPKVDVFVNHETSTVPFPYLPAATADAHSQNDFDNSQLSHLTIDRSSHRILSGRMAIRSSENYQRFCSNFLANREHGFDRPMVFTNEEAIDWVNRTGRAWPPPVGPAPNFEATDAARESGTVVAYDVRNRQNRPLWGMGRYNHENSVAVPGYGKPVLLSSDDTFVSLPPQSQLYMYTANNRRDVWNDRGDLLAFVADNPTVNNDYFDFVTGTPKSISGRFVKVPDFEDDPAKSIAHGRKANGTDVKASDFGFPAPPTSGWQLSPFGPTVGVATHGVDGPQWVLENWGDTLTNAQGQPTPVFQFIRLEDIAYDKRPGMQNIVYLIDSGAGSAGGPSPTISTNGRIWRMVLDPNNPTIVLSLSVLVDGDDKATSAVDPAGARTEIRQPDNLDTTVNGSMLVTEDPGSRQQFPATSTDSNRTTARVWQVFLPPATYDPLTATYDGLTKRVVASVVQTQDEELNYDEDPPDAGTPPPPAFLISPGNLGAWESSGVVDTSSVFGPGTFLITVQAHTLAVDWQDGDLNTITSNDPPNDIRPDFHLKREGGQLLLLKVPGA